MSSNGWIGVDLDGTLAHYDGWKGADYIGAPIPAMVERVKRWLAEGKTVKVFTARVYCPPEQDCWTVHSDGRNELEEFHARQQEAIAARKAIYAWCADQFGVALEVTCTKDYGMIELWDDRAVRVVPNTGEPCCK